MTYCINIDDEIAHRLRIFLASENSGKIHGKIGIAAAQSINQFINEKEKYIDDLGRKALGESRK